MVFGRMDDLIVQDKWRLVTNKLLYQEKRKSFPVVKVERDSGLTYERVWQLIMSPVLSATVSDVSYLLIHNKLAVPERLFRIGKRVDPYCNKCPGTLPSDCEHFFCSCARVIGSWAWVKSVLLDLLGVHDMSNEQILGYRFQKSHKDVEVVWLLGNYLSKVWDEIFHKGKNHLNFEELFGFLKFKYKADQVGYRYPLTIPGFS